ncbi:MAG: hypothetical protein ACP5NZ_04855, partial [Nanobdellota archaeon]
MGGKEKRKTSFANFSKKSGRGVIFLSVFAILLIVLIVEFGSATWTCNPLALNYRCSTGSVVSSAARSADGTCAEFCNTEANRMVIENPCCDWRPATQTCTLYRDVSSTTSSTGFSAKRCTQSGGIIQDINGPCSVSTDCIVGLECVYNRRGNYLWECQTCSSGATCGGCRCAFTKETTNIKYGSEYCYDFGDRCCSTVSDCPNQVCKTKACTLHQCVYTNVADGTSCGTGLTCKSGSCVAATCSETGDSGNDIWAGGTTTWGNALSDVCTSSLQEYWCDTPTHRTSSYQNCPSYSSCSGTPGRCVCNSGYTRSGNSCVPITQCTPGTT